MGFHMKKGLIFFSICLNLAFVGMGVYGAVQSGRLDHCIPGRGKGRMGLVDQLALDGEAKEEMRALLKAHHGEMGCLRREMQEKVLGLMTLMADPAPPSADALDGALVGFETHGRKKGEMLIRQMTAVRTRLPKDQVASFFSLAMDEVGRCQSQRKKQ